MELEIINRLFLELSQVTTATTRKELTYEAALRSILEAPEDTDGTLSMWMRLTAKEALRLRECDEARAALQHIATYPNITAAAMRDCARSALEAGGGGGFSSEKPSGAATSQNDQTERALTSTPRKRNGL